MPKSKPWYPTKELTYGSLYFFLKGKTFNINPFDKGSILEAKSLLLREARKASPNYQLFIKAAKASTGLSERSLKTLLYMKDINV